MEGALKYINRVLRRKAVVFLLSDFYLPQIVIPAKAGPPNNRRARPLALWRTGIHPDGSPLTPAGMTSSAEKLLAVTAKRHDLVALQIKDPREETLPDVGLIEWREAESGETLCVDSSDREVRRQFAAQSIARQRNLEALLSRHGIDHIILRTDRSFVIPLLQFFQSRVKRFR